MDRECTLDVAFYFHLLSLGVKFKDDALNITDETLHYMKRRAKEMRRLKRTHKYEEWSREYFLVAHRLQVEQIDLGRSGELRISGKLILEVAARLGVQKIKEMGYEEFEALCRRLGLL